MTLELTSEWMRVYPEQVLEHWRLSHAGELFLTWLKQLCIDKEVLVVMVTEVFISLKRKVCSLQGGRGAYHVGVDRKYQRSMWWSSVPFTGLTLAKFLLRAPFTLPGDTLSLQWWLVTPLVETDDTDGW